MVLLPLMGSGCIQERPQCCSAELGQWEGLYDVLHVKQVQCWAVDDDVAR
jgi:hypothetical protein